MLAAALVGSEDAPPPPPATRYARVRDLLYPSKNLEEIWIADAPPPAPSVDTVLARPPLAGNAHAV